ncbi:MAG: replication initiation protein [Raineya sp.]|jgi:plasmid replication initiation protein|nr:replication initiation protein [Raineya sp.]
MINEDENSGSTNFLETISKGYVKHSNKVTEASYSPISLPAKRLLAYLISAVPEPKSKKDEVLSSTIKVPVQDFIEKYLQTKSVEIGDFNAWKRKLFYNLREITKELLNMKILFEDDPKKGEYDGINVMERCKFSIGQNPSEETSFVFAFTRSVSNELYNLRSNFTTYNLIEYIGLSSSYSMTFYSLLARFKDSNSRWRKDDIEQLKAQLNCKDTYKNNHNFLQRVVLPVQKELENTSLAFDFELEHEDEKSKRGRKKIKFITFHLKNKNESIPQLIQESSWWDKTSQEIKNIVQILVSFGINEKLLYEHISLFNEEELSEIKKLCYEAQHPDKGVQDKIAYRNRIFLEKVKQKELEVEVKKVLEDQGGKQFLLEENKVEAKNPDIVEHDSFSATKKLNALLQKLDVSQDLKPQLVYKMVQYLEENNHTMVQEMLDSKSQQDLNKFLEK